MSRIDVRDIPSDELPSSSFPVSPQTDFRLHIAPEIHQGIWEHAKNDVSVEICGVLVGNWKRDENGPYASVTNFIRCDNAASKYAEVTFTHESWSQINQEMDTRYSEDRIVGWYHSHPDFGIFLSDRDCFIHEHFFSSPGQIALVVDPVRDIEGSFNWHGGKPTEMPYYWVGDSLKTTLKAAPASRQGAQNSIANEPTQGSLPSQSRSTSFFDLATMVLTGLLLFSVGYLFAGQRSQWEQRRLEGGVAAHYGVNKFLKIGLEEELMMLRDHLTMIEKATASLAPPKSDLDEAALKEDSLLRRNISKDLKMCQRALGHIKSLYGLTGEQREVLLMIYFQKQMEIERQIKSLTVPIPRAAKKSVNSPPTKKEPLKETKVVEEKPNEEKASTEVPQPKDK